MRTCALLITFLAALPIGAAADTPWKRHTIDASSKGADGVRLLDANSDGLPDIVTGWEQGGITRLYLHPGHAKAKDPWPAVTVGKTPSVEDAVLVDLDGDGAMDVVTSMEGKTARLSVHWGPKDRAEQLDPAAWATENMPAVDGRRWMFCVPMDLDGRHGVDLVIGGKGSGKNAADSAADSAVGWLEAPADPRKLGDWTFHPMTDAGWVMSIVSADMDGDGDADVLISDRYGPHKGVRWLANPGPSAGRDTLTGRWASHPIGAAGEVKFLTYADLDGDGLSDVVTGTEKQIHLHRRLDASGKKWASTTVAMPANTGGYKAATVADLDLDRRPDLVITCEGATGGKHGVFRLSYDKSPFDTTWSYHPISGSDGIKHDLCPAIDLDGDGDLDVVTTEENKPLGVVWYENPTK